MKSTLTLIVLFTWLPAAVFAEDRPNFLFAISDDQSWKHCGAYGDPAIQTPAFDRIAREGVLFTRAFCASPSCAPSRAALLTGRNIWELEEGGMYRDEPEMGEEPGLDEPGMEEPDMEEPLGGEEEGHRDANLGAVVA